MVKLNWEMKVADKSNVLLVLGFILTSIGIFGNFLVWLVLKDIASHVLAGIIVLSIILVYLIKK